MIFWPSVLPPAKTESLKCHTHAIINMSKKSATTYVVLQQNGTVANKASSVNPITSETIAGQIRKKVPLSQICTYKFAKMHIVVYGFNEGRAGTDNQTELPPPHDELTTFGDMFMVAYVDKSLKESVSFTTTQYAEFYEKAFDGYQEEDAPADAEESEDDEYDDNEDEAADDDIDEEEADDAVDDEDAAVTTEEPDFAAKYSQLNAKVYGGNDCVPEKYCYPDGWN